MDVAIHPSPRLIADRAAGRGATRRAETATRSPPPAPPWDRAPDRRAASTATRPTAPAAATPHETVNTSNSRTEARGGRDRRRGAGAGPADGAERRATATSSESGGTAELAAAATERAESGFAAGDAAGDGFHGRR